MIESVPMASISFAESHPKFLKPPTTPAQVQAYRDDMDHSLGVLATLILATRRSGAEGEDSIEELSVVKYAISSMDPVTTRISKTKTDIEQTRQQITKLEEKIDEASAKREDLLT